MNHLENIPDSVKAGVAVSAPALQYFGIDVEQWTFILSGIVSILFIIEKIPMLLERGRKLLRWIKSLKKE